MDTQKGYKDTRIETIMRLWFAGYSETLISQELDLTERNVRQLIDGYFASVSKKDSGGYDKIEL